MGIQNLLRFLANSTRDAHISEFENQFVAIDAYCWLHKGIYSCAFELAMKKPTLKYVTYCMRYIEMLLHFKVKPILVFDGRQLSSKSDTEKKRREERKKKYLKGKELMRAGKIIYGRKLLAESVDVTHELALSLMKECRKKNIDCIVAPYEADAQLAFLSLNKIVECVITEDSDLLVYGCDKVMFKMDTSGRGKIIEKSEIYFSLNMTPEEFNEENFRYMCILTGCDYLPSLPSIGPVSALKFIKMLKGNDDIYDALPKLPIYTNKVNIKVPSEYIAGFKIADNTFKHQLVYDPFLRLQVPLRPVKNDDEIVGTKLPDDMAFHLAVGNIDPITMKKVDNFDPDKVGLGFTILWKTDLLPNAISRQLHVSSNNSLIESKKRQRENLESDAVKSVTNNLKKRCTPPSSKILKDSSIKSLIHVVPKSGFIFSPKRLNEKKKVSNTDDKSKLLKSRYFLNEENKRRGKNLSKSSNDRQKDESYEDYLQRLYDEYFPESEEFQPEKGFIAESENSVSEKFCSSCSNCIVFCNCLNKNDDVSENQKLDECIRNIKELKKNREKFNQHFLLDEIQKNQSEGIKNKDFVKDNQIKVENDSGEKSPSSTFSLNLSNLLAKFDSLEKRNEGIPFEIQVVDKENAKVSNDHEYETVKNKDQEPKRSPSPVFKIQKDSKVLKRTFRCGNISDTASTLTSVYFSSEGSSSESKTQPSSEHTPLSSRQKISPTSGFHSAQAKAGKNNIKSSSVNKTLFQFGFKKQPRNENNSKE